MATIDTTVRECWLCRSLLWTELCPLQNLYVEALISSVVAYRESPFKMELKLNEVTWVGLSSNMISVLIRGQTPEMLCAQRKGHLRTQQEGICLQARNQPC